MSGPISYAETRISSLQRRTTKNEEIHDRHAWPVFADRSGRCVVRPPGRSCTEDREEKEDQQEEKRYKEGRRTGEVVVVADLSTDLLDSRAARSSLQAARWS